MIIKSDEQQESATILDLPRPADEPAPPPSLPIMAPPPPVAEDLLAGTPEEEPRAKEAEPAPEEAEPDAPRDAAPEEQEEVPLWARFRDETAQAAETSDQPDDDEPLWKRFQGQAEAPEPAPVSEESSPRIQLHPTPGPTPESEMDSASIEFAVLGPAAWERDIFIDKLFAGSAEAYYAALSRILKAEDWRTASDIVVVDVFRANRINIYEEAAIDFTNAVEAQFSKR